MSMNLDTARGGPIAGINVTPLIDVMLVLLILFMIVAPMTPRGLDATLPESPGPTPPPRPVVPLVLTVEEATFALNSLPVADPQALDEQLKEALGPRSDRTIFVRAVGHVSYGRVVAAMDAARGAGADRIGILGER
jgi:biopolymer transport protein ExbD